MTSHPPIHVRDARPDERDAIRDVTLQAYGQYIYTMRPEFWAGLRSAIFHALDAEGPIERIVAERDGRVVGSVMLYPAQSNAYGEATDQLPYPELRLLAVEPGARGLGLGAALTAECIRRARAAGARALGLHTSDDMQPAQRMYERLGFERVPQFDFRPGPGHLVKAYRLWLDEARQPDHPTG